MKPLSGSQQNGVIWLLFGSTVLVPGAWYWTMGNTWSPLVVYAMLMVAVGLGLYLARAHRPRAIWLGVSFVLAVLMTWLALSSVGVAGLYAAVPYIGVGVGSLRDAIIHAGWPGLRDRRRRARAVA